MTERMELGDRMRALITANIAEDDDASTGLLSDMYQDELAPMCGALVAYVGNMVAIIGAMWACSTAEAWERILQFARDRDLP